MDKMKELFRYTIGYIVVIGALFLVALLFFVKIPDDNRDVINQTLGIIIGMAVTVVAYEFGSSKSSSDKDQLLINASPKDTPPVLPNDKPTGA